LLSVSMKLAGATESGFTGLGFSGQFRQRRFRIVIVEKVARC